MQCTRLIYLFAIGLAVSTLSCPEDAETLLGTPAVFSTSLVLLDGSGRMADTFAQGESITLLLEVTNRTSSTAVLTFPTGQLFDFVVSDVANAEVWRWSHGRVFTTVVTPLEFAPGEIRAFTVVWSQDDNAAKPVDPGSYHAYGLAPVSEESLTSDRVPFKIE
jgi:hypothetical protein